MAQDNLDLQLNIQTGKINAQLVQLEVNLNKILTVMRAMNQEQVKGLEKGVKSLAKSTDSAQSGFGKIGESIKKVTSLYESMANSVKSASDTVGQIKSMYADFDKVKEKIESLATSEALTSMFGEGGTFAQMGAAITKPFTGLAASISGPVALVVGALALIALGIADLWATSATFRDGMTGAWELISGAVQGAWSMIWEMGLQPLIQNLQELGMTLYSFYESSGLKSLFEMVVTGITWIAGILGSTLIVMVSGAFTIILEVISGIIGWVTTLVENITWFFNNWDVVWAGIVDIATRCKDAVLAVWTMIVQKLQEVSAYISGIFNADWSKNFGFLGEILNVFFQGVQGAIDGIKRVLQGIIQFVQGVFTGNWSKAWNGIKEIFGGIWDSLSSIVKTPINAVITCLNKLLDGVENVVNRIADALSIHLDLPDAIEEVTGWSSFGISLPHISIPSIPHLAGGGIIPNMGQAFIARERGPELVGTFGRKSAVVNNSQIIESISAGVKEAVIEAMMVSKGTAYGGTPVVEVTLMADSETLYRTVQKGKEKYGRRYSVVAEM